VPAATGSAGGVGVRVSPEVAAWLKKAKIHVRRAWVLPAPFRTQHLEAHVLVDLDAGGNVVGVPRVVKRSGNPWFDEGVVRAIQKSSPLPAPPEPDEWAFVFVPGDSY
jgi:colicin import membrane protein